MAKVVTWVVIVAIIGGGIWYFMSRPSVPATAPTDTGASAASAPAQDTAANDTSDAQLQADLNASDSQIQSAGSAGASAGTFNDAPVTQTE